MPDPLQHIHHSLTRVGARRTGGGDWTCPVHDDRTASLSVKLNDAGDHILVRCGAGCDTTSVLDALGMAFADLFVKSAQRPGRRTKTVRYLYLDEDGGPLFRVTRKELLSGGKRFSQQGAMASGGWRSGKGAMQGVRLVLWRLPHLMDAVDEGAVIHLCEGEKDATALHQAGVFATCHPMGAGKWRTDYTDQLVGATEVIVWADRDRAGYRCARQRLTSLIAAGIPARAVLPIPEFKGADAFDHLAEGHSPDDAKPVSLEELAFLAEADESATTDDVLAAVYREFLLAASTDAAHDHLTDALSDDEVMSLPAQRFVIDGWVPAGAYTTIYGPPGIGKTLVVLGMHRAVRRGTRWQDHATVQGLAVNYVGEEVQQMQARIQAWDSRYPIRSDQTLASGYTISRLVDLTKPEGVAAVIRTVRALEQQSGDRIQLLTFDPLVEFMTGDENGDGMDRVTRGLRTLAALLDCGVVVGHHTNASEARARGADHLRMRCGAHIRMEHLDEALGTVGLIQEKQRNAARSALTLVSKEQGESVVLEWKESLFAQEYLAARSPRRRGEAKAALAQSELEARLVAALRDLHSDGELPMSQSQLNKVVGANHATFRATLDALENRGIVLVEEQGTGKARRISISPKWLSGSLGEDA